MKLANLYGSPSREVAVGHIEGVWRDLGREAGTRTIGLRRIETAAGRFSTPAHDHGADEEIFFVLSGDGLLWEEGKTCEVRAGSKTHPDGPGVCATPTTTRGPDRRRGWRLRIA